MRFNFKLSLIPIHVLLFGASSLHAAEPLNLRHVKYQALEKQFDLASSSNKKAMGIKSAQVNQLKLIRQHQDRRHITHFRYQQQYKGIDVFGGYAIVHAAKANNGLLATSQSTMNGLIYQGLADELGEPDSQYMQNANTALKSFTAPYQGYLISDEQVSPIIYLDRNHQAHWAYKVSVKVHYQDKIPAQPTAIIDAKTYKPFIEWNNIKTAVTAVNGLGYGGNAKIGQVSYDGTSYPYLELTRDKAKSLCYLNNAEVKVVDMQHQIYASRSPMSFACETPVSPKTPSVSSITPLVYWSGYQGDGYDRENGAYSPSNDALYFGYVINHLYHDWYDVNALSNPDGSMMKLVMNVHYGEGYENAFWDGMSMTFGDGADFFYPLVSLGVGAHEISHGFTEQHSDLAYFGESGGMNESFSDMAAQAAEFYSMKKSSWMIGSEIVKEGSGYEALRFMDLPSRDDGSIDTADEYYDGLDVHYSSGVYNHLFYLLANQPGWDTKKAFDVMVKANMDYWTPYSTFVEGACGLLSAAQDLNYSIVDVNRALDGVKVDYSECLG